MLTDAELLHRYAAEKSEPAFAELVARYVDLVFSAALRQVSGDAHRAQDVTQVVFTTLARKAPGLTRHPVLAGWLYTATQHAAAKAVRAEVRRHVREQEAYAMQTTHENAPLGETAGIDWQRVRPVLDDAMRELGERDREAVLLRYFARRPFAEIGTLLNVSEDGARMRVDRALDKLHALLARRGVTSTSAALAVALNAQAVAAAPAGVTAAITGAALASAATGASLGGAGAAAVLTFMSTAKIITAVVAIGGLAGLGLGLVAFQQARTTSEALAAITQERDALHARVKAAEARAEQALARGREVQSAKLAEPAPGRGGTAKPATMTPAELENAREKLEKAKDKLASAMIEKVALMANPEVQRVRLEMERLGLAPRYGQFYRSLNLTPEQIARFEARWTESRQDSADIFAAAQANGVAPNDPAILALAGEAKVKFENDLRTILGETGFAEFQRYERSYPAREIVSGMMANLISTGTPLSAGQVDQLTLAIAEQSGSYQKGERVGDKAGDVNWSAAIARVQHFLTPAQVDVVRAHAAHAQASQAATQTIMKVAPKPPSAAAPTARKPSGE
jgi:RNA polymerase sigma factor (sigma-70 family)